MTSPNPPTEAQKEFQAPAAMPEEAGQTRQTVTPEETPGDRLLSTEETMAMFRGKPEASEVVETPVEQEQSQMAQDFFQSGRPKALPAAPPTAPGTIPFAPPEMQRAVEQMQSTAQVPGQPVGEPAQQSPEMQALLSQNQILQTQLTTMQTQMQDVLRTGQEARQATQAAQAQAQPPAQTYNMDIPPQILAGIVHEDPNHQRMAVNALVNGVAETVTKQVRAEMMQQFQQVPQQIQQYVGRQTTAQQIQQDMYGTYPELHDYRQFVVAAAERLRPVLGDTWTPQLRDAIAEQVAPMVPGLYERIQAGRAKTVAQQQGQAGYQPGYPYQQPQQQNLPQQQFPQQLPQHVKPVGMAGGFHRPMQSAPQPMLVRDASGQLVQVMQAPQPYVGGSQVRPNGSQIDPELADIWHTLSYS